MEHSAGLDRVETFVAFGERVQALGRASRAYLEDRRAAGALVAAYGAPVDDGPSLDPEALSAVLAQVGRSDDNYADFEQAAIDAIQDDLDADLEGVTEAGWDDAIPVGRAYIEAAPDRIIWATDWPHPMWTKRMMNDAEEVELLYRYVDGDATLLRKILVDNPARLHGFKQQ